MASTSTSNVSNVPARVSHPVTVSGVIENSANLQPNDNRSYTFRSCTVAITCNGWDGDREAEYDGTFTAYCGAMQIPLEDHCYAMKARFIPATDTAAYTLYYEADHKILVGTTESFLGELNNNTAITGLGIVTSRTTIPDEATGKDTLCFVMSHVDYQPEARVDHSFEIEYRIRPTRNLEKSQNLIQLERETLINGYIVDWDEDNLRWIVEVTSVSNCTGRQQGVSKKNPPAGGQVTPAGRVKPAKHVPSSTPTKSAKTINAKTTPKAKADPKGKRKAANQEIPGSEDEEIDSEGDELEESTPPLPTRKAAKKPAKPKAKKAKATQD